MSEFTMIAKFIGSDGSLGYRTGRVYRLTVTMYSWLQRWLMAGRAQFHIVRSDGTGECPYQSIRSFQKNWKVIKVPAEQVDFIVGQLPNHMVELIQRINENPYYSEPVRRVKIARVLAGGSHA